MFGTFFLFEILLKIILSKSECHYILLYVYDSYIMEKWLKPTNNNFAFIMVSCYYRILYMYTDTWTNRVGVNYLILMGFTTM